MPATLTEDPAAFIADAGRDGRLYGLDLGTKTLGIARSDPARMFASPLITLARGKFTQLSADLRAHGEADAVVGFVLGLPRNMDGSSGTRVQATRAFARNLADALPQPILLWDERLSTVEAERLMIAADTRRDARARKIDQVAAAIILQGALDRMRGIDLA
ncbi:MAG: Holliday junction resolvase RuvX [Pseudomonadota bacterium]